MIGPNQHVLPHLWSEFGSVMGRGYDSGQGGRKSEDGFLEKMSSSKRTRSRETWY